jgi:hypothetical protein
MDAENGSLKHQIPQHPRRAKTPIGLTKRLVLVVEEISPLKDMSGVVSADLIWKPRRANDEK